MARSAKKGGSASAATADPEGEERKRLKELAFAKSVLSQSIAKVGLPTALGPSKTLIKHHGKDILRKSQRKNKYLFSFPGLLGPISGGKIGELKDLGTKNPILYLDFPQGQLKLFGTIIYPKNRYLTLQFSRGGKNVTCDDYFDNMIVFSDAWWIGTKDENPEEVHLPFPEEMMKKQAECDFKGGIGVPRDRKQCSEKISTKLLERMSQEHDVEDDSTDSPSDLKEMAGVTPIRHSSRTAGKTFKFAEGSSGDDLTGIGAEMSEEEDEKVGVDSTTYTKTESFSPIKFKIDNQDVAKEEPASGKNKRTAKSKDHSSTGRTPLVQTSISTLFKKAEEKASRSSKVGNKLEVEEAGTGMKEQKKQLKRTELVDSVTVYQKKSKGKSSGVSSLKKGQADLDSVSLSSDPIESSQVEVDEIEDFSCSSQDMDASDEDWTS